MKAPDGRWSIGKLLLLTGARRDEVAGMKWSELDLAARVRSLPAARTKNKQDQAIPLSDAAMSVIKGLPRIGEQKGLVLRTTGATPVSGFSRAKAAIGKTVLEVMRKETEARGDEAGRRQSIGPSMIFAGARNHLQKLGVKLEVTEAVLNHVSGSRAGIVEFISVTIGRPRSASPRRLGAARNDRRGRAVGDNVTPLRRPHTLAPSEARQADITDT